ncbi:MAG: MarR family transcriptional regulator [Microbacterium sp.]|uniref:MarR family winged helix-turn-helix transcriptional regulator n=1 Tax=Microbacterium sp. TaxID=51671 RepID=UPI002719451C|nr:MarR family transcriptional regulator [Microbacterium sp.]MDO8381372.1 MarR family transcriptional regulator [Microbacterium sp.]
MESNRGLVYIIKQLDLALRPRLFEACAAAGMTAAQYTAMTVLARRPGITSSELARRSFVRAQTMAATMDPLFDSGYVRRESDPLHRRRILLFLTESGAEAVAGLTPQVEALEDLLVSDLSESEREQFGDYLRRARNALDRAGHRVPAAPESDLAPADP